MLNLKIIIASTRPGRKGPSIAAWFYEVAKQHTGFTTTLVDLADVGLPLLDEPEHPRLQQYTKQHTKDWSAIVNSADAFVIVTSEYNYGLPASMKNAIDFLFKEWQYKPVGFVSYGGVSGGTRSVQMLKQVVTAVDMMPLSIGVHIPAFGKRIDESGKFNGDAGLDKSGEVMLNELHKWATALKPMRG
jgi:NAD(P)H-dependent FMN reductase